MNPIGKVKNITNTTSTSSGKELAKNSVQGTENYHKVVDINQHRRNYMGSSYLGRLEK